MAADYISIIDLDSFILPERSHLNFGHIVILSYPAFPFSRKRCLSPFSRYSLYSMIPNFYDVGLDP